MHTKFWGFRLGGCSGTFRGYGPFDPPASPGGRSRSGGRIGSGVHDGPLAARLIQPISSVEFESFDMPASCWGGGGNRAPWPLRAGACRRRSPAHANSNEGCAQPPDPGTAQLGWPPGAALFLVPASVVPVPAQVRLVLGHYHQMEPAPGDDAPAPRTQVGLGRRRWLDGADGQPPRNAHTTRAAVRASAPATKKMSAARRRRLRNGLNPMPRCYRSMRWRRAQRRAGGTKILGQGY